MRRIFAIVLGELSTGELIIAQSFAQTLNKDKYSVDFLIPEDKEKFFREINDYKIFTISQNSKNDVNQDYIVSLTTSNKYDLIILFDAFTFEYAQHWTGVNIELLKTLGIPIATLDEYDYLNTGYKLDYYGVFVKKLPDLVSKVDLVFKNCPLSMPRDNEKILDDRSNGKFYYKAIQEIDKIEEKTISNIRKKYISERGKIVFLTLSKWELEGAYSFSSQNTLCKYLLPLVYYYLMELDEDICLIHVGESCWEETDFQNSKIKYVHYNSLPIKEFESLLQASDLYITYNLVSITLTKAVVLGIPSIVFNNDKIIDFSRLRKKCREKPLWYQRMAMDLKVVYPFTASMFGWNHFLKPIMKDNIYMKTFKRVQGFNTEKSIATINNIFHGRSTEDIQENINLFKKELSKLPDANEVLDDAFIYLLNKGGII